ncbi:MAG: hypothetical protein ABIL09_03695 [Gemmatimonadota bacterium]
MTAAAGGGGFRAGFAAVEITPAPGTHLAGRGDGAHRSAEAILDPLYARAAVFEHGGRRVCFLILDVTIVTRPWTERLRRAAADQWGFAPEAVMVAATQTHSAPPLGHFMVDDDFPALPAEQEYLRGGETAYFERACNGAVEAIAGAVADLAPAAAAAGSAVRDGLAFNRRGITRDGRVTMPWFYSSLQQPLGPTHIRYLEGPVDPEVGVLCFRGEDLAPRGALLHYTCHPVNVFAQPGNAVSADWPGAWAHQLRERLGMARLPVVLNGCCGNLNPWPAFEPDFHPDHRRMGAILAERAEAVARQLRYGPVERLDWRCRRVPLHLKSADPERLAAAAAMLAEHPQPLWSAERPGTIHPDWFRAASVMSVELMRRRGPDLAYEIQAFRLGDTAVVGLPGEPFVEGQLAIKLASPAAQTFVAHAATEYVGYLPTRAAHARGGHEVDFSYWAKLAPEALDRVVEETTVLLRELF